MKGITPIVVSLFAHSNHAVHDAARGGHYKRLRYLLGNYPKQRLWINTTDESLSPLQMACVRKNYACMVLLLEYGAWPDAESNGFKRWTALESTLARKDRSAARLLMLSGAKSMLLDLQDKPDMQQFYNETKATVNFIDEHYRLAKQAIDNQAYQQAANHYLAIYQAYKGVEEIEPHAYLKEHYAKKALEAIQTAYRNNPTSELQALLNEQQQAISTTYAKKPTLMHKLFPLSQLFSSRQPREDSQQLETTPLIRQHQP